uniref:Glycosyl transferase CAP10 domain-containing protein n=1 Tax=Pseudo-nitzschia australis TaxID=44445 RepID=A0A7S4ATT9_9STRA
MPERCNLAMISFHQEDTPKAPVKVDVLEVPNSRMKRITQAYNTILRNQVFSSKCRRDLPRPQSSSTQTSAVIFGLQSGDWSIPKFHRFHCFASSSTPGGFFNLFNFLTIRDMAVYRTTEIGGGKFTGLPKVPWDKRDPIPIWRGTLWGSRKYFQRIVREAKKFPDQTPQQTLDRFFEVLTKPKGYHHQRIPLMGFSIRHPDLLNARGSRERIRDWEEVEKLITFPNSTITADDFFPPVKTILPRDFNSKYQVMVVMGGIGAAFRTADHLSMESAVILQDYPYEEWFVAYMTPYVNYIPLAMDLSNLSEILHWVRDNPQKVREIAINGRLFFERYLSYEKIEEFLYELVYRLSEAKIYKGIHLDTESLNLKAVIEE